MIYVGQTNRVLNTRVGKHKKNLRRKCNHHNVLSDHRNILHSESNNRNREPMKMLYLKSEGNIFLTFQMCYFHHYGPLFRFRELRWWKWRVLSLQHLFSTRREYHLSLSASVQKWNQILPLKWSTRVQFFEWFWHYRTLRTISICVCITIIQNTKFLELIRQYQTTDKSFVSTYL